jgi:CheY-like chemotaxis protein/MinD-like ATPase involved in chromosome partitioning or flagellar assembly
MVQDMSGENILVVDDDPDSVRLITLVLRREGYLVRPAIDGEMALSIVEGETPDLVVLDVMMPNLDGCEVARRLRANPRTAEVPILMFTAKARAEDVTDGLRAGANDYLTKPVRPADLVQRVAALLGGRISERAAGPPEPPPGHVIAFLGVKGGEGTTTLALNCALALQARPARAGQRVILAEITPGQGALSLMIDAPSGDGVPGLLREPGRLSPEGIEAELVEYGGGLRLLLTPPGERSHSRLMLNESTNALVDGLARLADFVVVDLGSGLQAHSQHVAAIADQVVLVLEVGRVSLALGSEIAAALTEEGVEEGRLGAVLTSRHPESRPLAYRGIEEVLGVELLSAIGAAPELADRAVEAATPMVLLSPDDPVSAQIVDLAQALVERAEALAGRTVSASG